jgi:hypothetical protein
VHDQPEIWEETRDIDVPWGEIDIGCVIFTLPSTELRKVRDFRVLKEAYDRFTQKISTFLSYNPESPIRVVFDVEGDSEPSDGLDEFQATVEYPATFLLEEVHNLVLDISEPSWQLFKALFSIARLSLRLGCFDAATEVALITVAAALALQDYYEGFDPFLSGFPLPLLFPQFWEIEAVCPGVFSKTMLMFQDPDYQPLDSPDDMWVEFVRELCRSGHCNFTKVLEQSKPVPLNISVSIADYPLMARKAT